MDSLYQTMQKRAIECGNKTAIVFYGKRYSFNKMLSLVDRAAAGLKALGVQSGSVVTLCMPNTPSAQIAFYALNRLGAIVSLVHPYISAAQLNKSMQHTKSLLLIAYDIFLSGKGNEIDSSVKILKSNSDYFMSGTAKLYYKLINRKKKRYKCDTLESLFVHKPLQTPCALFDKNSPAVYLPSGGTTSAPKTIMHNCGVFNELCFHAEFFLSRPIAEYNSMYSVLPIFHGFGLCMNMHMCAVHGLKNVMSIKFNPSAMAKAIKKEKVNVITGVPAMYQKLLACDDFMHADLSSIYDCFVGGDSAGERLIDEFNAALNAGGSNAKLYEGYGLTETVTVCTVGCLNRNKAASVGYPLPNTVIKIVKDGIEVKAGEVGEIYISTPLMMLGYLDENNTESLNDYKPCAAQSAANTDLHIQSSTKHEADTAQSNTNHKNTAQSSTEYEADTAQSNTNHKNTVLSSTEYEMDIAQSNTNHKNTALSSTEYEADTAQSNTSHKNTAQSSTKYEADTAQFAKCDDLADSEKDIKDSIKIIDGQRWLMTGDLGYVDKDGFLFFKQRAKSMIKVSGIPVFPSEIEAVAESVSGVIRAAAIGIDDSASGQAVKLFVQSNTTDHQQLKDAILAECKQKLIPYALPKIIEIKAELPLNTIGKIDRKKL